MDKKHIGSSCRKTFLGGLVSAAFPQQAVPGDRRGGFANLVCLPVAPKAQGKRVLAEKDGAADTLRTPGTSRFDTLKGCESDFFGILHFTFYYQCVIYVSKAARMCRQSFAGKR